MESCSAVSLVGVMGGFGGGEMREGDIAGAETAEVSNISRERDFLRMFTLKTH